MKKKYEVRIGLRPAEYSVKADSREDAVEKVISMYKEEFFQRSFLFEISADELEISAEEAGQNAGEA